MQEIKKSGYGNLHILTDFDRTLTYGCIDGIKTPSIIAMLRDGNHLTPEYTEKARSFADKYHTIEIDPDIPIEEKKISMREWWAQHTELLIQSGLSKADLEDIVQNGPVKLRRGVTEFLDILQKNNIPLVIISSSGCGDAIRMYFEKNKSDYENIFYVTNQFVWDEAGKAISAKQPIINCMNKDETILQNIPEVYRAIKNRKNVILLGDSPGDLGMIEGFNYANLLKIGFQNCEYNSEEEFKKYFDIILQGDETFDYINSLVKTIK